MVSFQGSPAYFQATSYSTYQNDLQTMLRSLSSGIVGCSYLIAGHRSPLPSDIGKLLPDDLSLAFRITLELYAPSMKKSCLAI